MKLSISLNKPKAAQSKAPVLRPSAFGAGADDDGEEEDAFSKKAAGPLAHKVESSKAMRKRMEAEKRVDETVFEYDEVWDKMQEAKERQKVAKEADSTVRKVCSIPSPPLRSSAQRALAKIYPEPAVYSCHEEIRPPPCRGKADATRTGTRRRLIRR